LYPSYNEEHGIWVDHKATVDGWVEGYWDVLWKATKAPKDDNGLDFKVSDFDRDEGCGEAGLMAFLRGGRLLGIMIGF